jgi:Putative metallopeptidase
MESSRWSAVSQHVRIRVTPLGMSCLALWIALVAMPASTASADEQRPNRIRIEYVPPKDHNYQRLVDNLKANHALEKMQEMFGSFRLANDVNLRTMECGMANAWYQRPTVTICYEYIDDIRKGIPKETAPAGITQSDAVLGQFLYVVAHEMGHGMFDNLNVPLFGRPEDAADQFATYIMLMFGKQDARRLIDGAAYGYKEYVRNPKVTVPLVAFSEAHGAPMQRFYNLLCMAYGADQETFGDLVEHRHLPEARALFQGHLPEARARGCRVEFGEVNFAFQQTIRPHVDQELAKAVLQSGWLPDVLAQPDLPPPPPHIGR